MELVWEEGKSYQGSAVAARRLISGPVAEASGVDDPGNIGRGDMIIGPILARSGGYCFDTWTVTAGIKTGYSYRRIEDAYYDWRTTFRVAEQQLSKEVIICKTAEEFQLKVSDRIATRFSRH
jgi:hypothetical protein